MPQNVQYTSSEQCLQLLSKFPYFFVFEDHLMHPSYKGFKNIAGGSMQPALVVDEENHAEWESLIEEQKQDAAIPLFYFISYEFRKALESLELYLPTFNAIPWIGSIKPEVLFSSSKKGHWKSEHEFSGSEFPINKKEVETFKVLQKPQALESKELYIKKLEHIQHLIREGTVYELNYCLFFEAKIQGFDPIKAYNRLSELSPMPFSSLVRWDQQYIICASPELYMQYDGNHLITKPIKGTVRKSEGVSYEEASKILKTSEKELAENMMIVDLSRNDLNKYCIPGSVKVPELFGVYEFPQLYHMISTVSGIPEAAVDPMTVLLKSFPMGSMTGAPKISAMNVIESLESAERSLFSGSIGYKLPDGTFDFNVVIRSIFYDASTGSIRFMAGSAITIDSDPHSEYDECLTKAKSIFQLIEEIACNNSQ